MPDEIHNSVHKIGYEVHFGIGKQKRGHIFREPFAVSGIQGKRSIIYLAPLL